jgi:hypothetical protein
MDKVTRNYFNNLTSEDKNAQYEAYVRIMETLDEPVDWAYEVWDELREDLTHSDNHRRSRAAQFLSGLAKSDPERKILNDFAFVWEVTKDPMFVTARHSLQSIWKIGLAGEDAKKLVLDALYGRYASCVKEKNSSMIRFDILQGLKRLYDKTNDEEIKAKSLELIEAEDDIKYRKKYAALWK